MEELSRKERRKLLRQQKKQEKEAKRNIINLKKLFITIFGVFVLGFFGYKTYRWATSPVPQVVGAAVESTEGDWIKGSREARVTIIEYSDFQCPACKSYAPLMKRISDEYGDKLAVIYRHFPLPQHKNAFAAAKASEAAGKQGKFWEMHDLLFDKLDEWSNESDIVARFEEYAGSLGLDKDKWRVDYESEEIEDAIEADITLANSLQVSSTPTFVLNGKKTVVRGYEDLKGKIESELNSN